MAQSGRRPDVTRVFNDGIGNANFRVAGPNWTTFPEHFKVYGLCWPINYPSKLLTSVVSAVEPRILHDGCRQNVSPRQSAEFRPTHELVQHDRVSVLLPKPNKVRCPHRCLVPDRQCDSGI